jgi:hypothetical protein
MSFENNHETEFVMWGSTKTKLRVRSNASWEFVNHGQRYAMPSAGTPSGGRGFERRVATQSDRLVSELGFSTADTNVVISVMRHLEVGH